MDSWSRLWTWIELAEASLVIRASPIGRMWCMAVQHRYRVDGRLVLWTWRRMMEMTRLEWEAQR